jgi:hypothetical protein
MGVGEAGRVNGGLAGDLAGSEVGSDPRLRLEWRCPTMAERVKCEMTTMADHRPFILKARLKSKLCVTLPNWGSSPFLSSRPDDCRDLGELSLGRTILPREDRFLSISINFCHSQNRNPDSLPLLILPLCPPLPPSPWGIRLLRLISISRSPPPDPSDIRLNITLGFSFQVFGARLIHRGNMVGSRCNQFISHSKSSYANCHTSLCDKLPLRWVSFVT